MREFSIRGALASRVLHVYSFQTFAVAEVLLSSKMNQIEINIRDHVHGSAGVSDTGTFSSATFTNLVMAGLLDLTNAAAGQIQFPATQNASSNVNCLDDYEEGTFTPSIGGSATYNLQVGQYTKVGNRVIYGLHISVAAPGTGSTTTVSGLPFTTNGVHSADLRVVTSATAIVSSHAFVAAGSNTVAVASRTAASTTDSIGTSIFNTAGSEVYVNGHYTG